MSKAATISVKFAGGPLAGQTLKLPHGTERHTVARMWTYVFGGKVGSQIFFALWPRARGLQRAILNTIGATGRHPYVDRELQKRQPRVRPYLDPRTNEMVQKKVGW